MTETSSGQSKILIVEDNPEWVEVIKKRLRPLRLDFADVSNVDGVVAELSKQVFDLVIADLELTDRSPKLDTLADLIAAIQGNSRPENHHPPIIVMTGHEIAPEEFERILNNHPGFIWGWYRKLQDEVQIRDSPQFQATVRNALQTRASMLQRQSVSSTVTLDLRKLTLKQILEALRPVEFWGILTALIALIGGAYWVGVVTANFWSAVP